MHTKRCFNRETAGGLRGERCGRRRRGLTHALCISLCAALPACSSPSTDANAIGTVTPFAAAPATEPAAATAASNETAAPAAASKGTSESSESGVTVRGIEPSAGGASNVSNNANAAGNTGTAGTGMGTGAAGTAMTGAAGALTGQAGSMGAAGTGNMPPSSPTAAANCPANALFCDDFEEDVVGQFPGAPWQNQTGSTGATIQVDGMQAFSGTKAVHVHAPPNAAYRRGYFSLIQGQGGSTIFPAVSNLMFGRAMMWLDATPNADVHWTVIQAEGRAADGTHDTYYRYGGQHQNGAGLMASYETNMNVKTDCYTHSAMTIPTGAWTCMEWRFSTQTNEMQLWINGNEITDLHVVDRPTDRSAGCAGNDTGGEWIAPPNFTTLHLGWENYQTSTNDRNLWVDDVVVSTERIGCPAP
jgi:hypothetical protein